MNRMLSSFGVDAYIGIVIVIIIIIVQGPFTPRAITITITIKF